jgi:16S rRNA C1402 N4-methylase RsmH
MYPGGGGHDTRVLIPGEGQFIEYESDEQFAPLALKIARAAEKRARYFRDLFPSIDAAAKVLAECEGVDWDIEAGVASGLIGDCERAHKRFEHYLQWDESEDGQAYRGEWMDARADRVRALTAEVDDTERFRAMIAEDIRTVRTAAKLDPDVDLPF